jgi:acyl carrier protein
MKRRPKDKRAPTSALVTEHDIQAWLSARIAEMAELPHDAIEMDRPLADFGINSVQVAELAGDLEAALGRSLPETALWDFPTIALLAAFLSGRDVKPVDIGTSEDDARW